MHALLNLSALQFRWLAVEDIDWLEIAFKEVHSPVEESAKVAGDSSLRVMERTPIGLSNDREELIERVVGVYGQCLAFKLRIVNGFRGDEVAEVEAQWLATLSEPASSILYLQEFDELHSLLVAGDSDESPEF